MKCRVTRGEECVPSGVGLRSETIDSSARIVYGDPCCNPSSAPAPHCGTERRLGGWLERAMEFRLQRSRTGAEEPQFQLLRDGYGCHRSNGRVRAPGPGGWVRRAVLETIRATGARSTAAWRGARGPRSLERRASNTFTSSARTWPAPGTPSAQQVSSGPHSPTPLPLTAQFGSLTTRASCTSPRPSRAKWLARELAQKRCIRAGLAPPTRRV